MEVFGKKFVLAVSTSALFDLRLANKKFLAGGEEAFMKHTEKTRNQPYKLGAAAGFVYKMLRLNQIGIPVVLAIVSRQDSFGATKVYTSLREHGLEQISDKPLSVGDIYNKGQKIDPAYLKGMETDLFLSTNEEDVSNALAAGVGAALIPQMPPKHMTEKYEAIRKGEDGGLKLGFDFDRVIAIAYGQDADSSIDSEEFFHRRYTKTRDVKEALIEYFLHERQCLDLPCSPGPLGGFYLHLCAVRNFLQAQSLADKFKMELSVITKRTNDASARMINTLRKWNAIPDLKRSCGTVPKGVYAKGLDIYFDDSLTHIKEVENLTLPSFVPWQSPQRGLYDLSFQRAQRFQKGCGIK